MGSRRRKRLLSTVTAAVALLVIYVGSYAALAAAGGYRPSQTGRHRYAAGLSVTDVEHWQPALAHWEPFRDVTGDDTSRGNVLGYLYSPLIRLDRAWRHPSVYYLSD